ncbi:MAG: carboxypeptidase regulatory-like domain-containing protein [Candidatus Solibacter usitatus]|nr:carboxypeptidase regulatory-like domain-containing protein [Candidatus Solibacter usitatus]
MIRSSHRLAVLLALSFLLSLAVHAQSDSARLQGMVKDTSGLAVEGATVAVTSLATSRVTRTETHAQDGSYSVPALPVGRYRVEVSKAGFHGIHQELTLQVAQVASLNFTLEIGQVTEVVNVVEEAALVDAVSSDMGKSVVGRQVTELPLNGRNFTQLATLIPGVTRGVPDGQASGAQGNAETFRNGTSGGAALAINGLRPQANSFLLDGVDNNESLVNTIVFFPPAEAIQEFRVQTSIAPAEFGRAGGGIINTSIKSGSNEVHGSAFEFLRNSELDARPTFAPGRNPFQRNQFGGTLGGPIVKNKLFAFGDYQGLRQSTPLGTDFASVPTPEFRAGDFSLLLDPARSGQSGAYPVRDLLTGAPFPGNRIPQSRLNPVGQKYLSAFPLPNTNAGRATQNYVTQRKQIQEFNDFDIRIDYLAGLKDSLFGRVSYGQDSSVTTSRLPGLPAGFGSGQNFNHTRGVVLGETHTFTPSLLNELRLAFTRVHYGYAPPFQDQKISADLGIPNANTSPLLGGGALIGGWNGQLEYTGDFGPYGRLRQRVHHRASFRHGGHPQQRERRLSSRRLAGFPAPHLEPGSAL